jgi:hypothetical protein
MQGTALSGASVDVYDNSGGKALFTKATATHKCRVTVATPTKICVTDTSEFTVGQTIFIQSEKMSITAITAGTKAFVDSTANLASNINASTASVPVDDGTKFTAGDLIRIDSEYMGVNSISSNTLTCVKGVGGTTKATHTSGADVYKWDAYLTVTRGAEGSTACNQNFYGASIYYSTTATTDSNGNIYSSGTTLFKLVRNAEWKNSGGTDVQKDYTPFKIVVRKNGYMTGKVYITPTGKASISEVIKLISSPYVNMGVEN